MKRFCLILLLISFMFCLSGCFLDSVSLFYSDLVEKDGFYIAINDVSNCCYVGSYNCTDYVNDMKLIIPDECDGKPIKRIGGYFGRGVPDPFGISLESYMNAPEETEYDAVYGGDINEYGISDDFTVEEVAFNLHIGKNIEAIDYVVMDEYFPHINEDESITFYHPVVSVTCAEENKHFYAKDGKLYNKHTDELVNDFDYKE